MYTVHPNNQECFYLRLLLLNVQEPKPFEDLRTVNSEVLRTCREACQASNLLENDSHCDITFGGASSTAHPLEIRLLFAIVLTTCSPSNPKDLWEKYKYFMSEDILFRKRVASQNPNLQLSTEDYNEALILIEDICVTISNKRLEELGMLAVDRPPRTVIGDRDIDRETNFNINDLAAFVEINLPKLVPEQRYVYDMIMQAISNHSGGFYFLDAPGGTGRTFLDSI